MKKTEAGRPSRSDKAATKYIKARVTEEERQELQKKAERQGYSNFSDWLRHIMLAA